MSGHSIVELTGHIVDSLTLAKVIDKIQAVGCRYQINDLQVGREKTDTSYAMISLWTESPEELRSLLDELKHYGVHPIEDDEAELAPCPEDGRLPDGYFLRLNPKTEVFVDGRWLPVERSGLEIGIVVDRASGTASLKRADEVKEGDRAVMGLAGVRVLPKPEADRDD